MAQVPDEQAGPDREQEWRPVTEQQRARAAAAIAQLRADLARAGERSLPPDAESERFFGPIGLDADGNLQPPLTAEEVAYLAAARRGELPGATENGPPDEHEPARTVDGDQGSGPVRDEMSGREPGRAGQGAEEPGEGSAGGVASG